MKTIAKTRQQQQQQRHQQQQNRNHNKSSSGRSYALPVGNSTACLNHDSNRTNVQPPCGSLKTGQWMAFDPFRLDFMLARPKLGCGA